MSLSVQLTRAAGADLDRLPAADREHVIHDVRTLAEVPIGGAPRVLYRIDESIVTIMRVINRRDLERTLRQLRR